CLSAVSDPVTLHFCPTRRSSDLLENNIYVQVGLIMLIGLLAKNAILIVEFAVQQRRAGLSIVESALEGSRMRLRPILMTSLAFRSEEHTSELQSRENLVCRLLLE